MAHGLGWGRRHLRWGLPLGVGIPFGLLFGYRGGFIDALISRYHRTPLLAARFLISPSRGGVPGPEPRQCMIAIGISTRPIFVRLTAASDQRQRVEVYVEAGPRPWAIPRWRIWGSISCPNIMPRRYWVQATLSIAAAIIAGSGACRSLPGQQPPAPSWGSMLNAAHAPHQRAMDGDWAGAGNFSRGAVGSTWFGAACGRARSKGASRHCRAERRQSQSLPIKAGLLRREPVHRRAFRATRWSSQWTRVA